MGRATAPVCSMPGSRAEAYTDAGSWQVLSGSPSGCLATGPTLALTGGSCLWDWRLKEKFS